MVNTTIYVGESEGRTNEFGRTAERKDAQKEEDASKGSNVGRTEGQDDGQKFGRTYCTKGQKDVRGSDRKDEYEFVRTHARAEGRTGGQKEAR